MKHPVRVHAVQKLTGCLAALSRFISRLGEKALPLYRLMKKADKFEWTPEADAAFAELKTLLSTQPVLAAPISKEPLLLYIAATGQVVGTVLTVEREEEGKAFKVQRPSVLSLCSFNPVEAKISSLSEARIWDLHDHEEGCSLFL